MESSQCDRKSHTKKTKNSQRPWEWNAISVREGKQG